PYVDEKTRLVPASRWIDFTGGRDVAFERGGIRFRLIDVGGAHSPEDIMLWVENDRVLLAGDLYFSGRIPFVGNADTRSWLATLDVIAPLKPASVIPGHGAASRDPAPDIALTREYMLYLREQMGKAARDLVPFDEAYAAVDWSRFEKVPAFAAANRINAYGTYLAMEQEALTPAAARK
ncbi:MAG TPA: MBL fold metallo-hydrolase, partial [Burkholderiaceae bacterium]|nr:MBL fold metallo-hydrolase [Burkholderiaceae bacterium]